MKTFVQTCALTLGCLGAFSSFAATATKAAPAPKAAPVATATAPAVAGKSNVALTPVKAAPMKIARMSKKDAEAACKADGVTGKALHKCVRGKRKADKAEKPTETAPNNG